MRPVKVLFVTDDFSKGGTARVVDNIVRGLSSSFEARLACLDAVGGLGGALAREGVEVRCWNRRPGTDWVLIRKLARYIRREKIAIVHAHQTTAYFYGGLAAIWAGGVKLIFTEHGRPYPDTRKTAKVLVNRFLLCFTAAVTAVSQAVKNSLITYEGVPPSRIRVLLNGIAGEAFRGDFDAPSLKAEWGVGPSEPLIGMVARLGEEKDHETLLKALPLIRERLPDIKLVLVGDGPKGPGLKKLAARLGVEERVIFLGNRSDVPRILAALDLVVLSSFYEGTSITLLEAMFAGKAALASRVGGNAYILEDKESGLLFSPGNAADLADKAVLLLSDNDLKERMERKALQRAQALFTRRRMVERYEALYREVLDVA